MTVDPSYTDTELRLAVLPHAMKLLDKDIYRMLGQCNTKATCQIVTELVHFVKTGSVPSEDTTFAQPVPNSVPVAIPTPIESNTNDQGQTQAA